MYRVVPQTKRENSQDDTNGILCLTVPWYTYSYRFCTFTSTQTE